MHIETLELFKQAISDSLLHVQPQVGKFTEMYQVWHKESESNWRSTYEERIDIQKTLHSVADVVKASSSAFGESFIARHPEHAGMVGFSSNRSNLGKNPTHIVMSALHQLWWRHKTFELQSEEVDTIVQEFSDFIDRPSVKLKFQTQLLNFKMTADSLDLSPQLTIRKLTEEEVSRFHGGPIGTLGFTRPQSLSIQEFSIEGEIDEPKVLSDAAPHGDTMAARAKILLDKAILCLRTFKEGHVGYDFIHFRPITFCPVGMFASGSGDLYVPFGNYSLIEEELQRFSVHAKLIFGVTEESMKMACSRLADAEHRTRPQDRIVDAVIGMEAILLSGIEERRGELSFRFSLNYAMLFPVEERQYAYKVARDLYILRSTIAHGSNFDGAKLKIAGKKVQLPEAAKTATEALRMVIMHFLPKKDPIYKNHEFWQRAYFGLPDAT